MRTKITQADEKSGNIDILGAKPKKKGYQSAASDMESGYDTSRDLTLYSKDRTYDMKYDQLEE